MGPESMLEAATEAVGLHKTDREWLQTPEGDSRGYIQPHTLRELWFHTGTACNLSCPFCLEGSKPGDRRLDWMYFDDVKPWIDEATAMGVEQFSFTGGEPFVIREIFQILDYALDRRPCLVLTNGTIPLLKRMPDLLPLRDKPNAVSFRISLDYANAEQHDAGRGEGNFARSLECIGKLRAHGFNVSVARQMEADEDFDALDGAYRDMFEAYGVPRDTHIVAFPDFAAPGSIKDVPQITEDCMTRYHDAAGRAGFMCAFSKMVVKRDRRMRVYACTLVDDDEDFDLGGTLAESMRIRVMLKHHRCYACFALGASCSESG